MTASDSGTEPGFLEAIEKLHAAMAGVANGDVSKIVALHSAGDDVTSFYGWGGYEKGTQAVARRWDWAGEQFKGGIVSYQNLARASGAEHGYTIDIETFETRLAGVAEPVRWSNRVTHIFRRENGEWRLVHRHASRLEERRAPGAVEPAEAAR